MSGRKLQQQALSACGFAALDLVPPANVSSATEEDAFELAEYQLLV